MLLPPQVLSPTAPVGGQQQPSQLASALMQRAQMPQLPAPSFSGGFGSLASLMQNKNNNDPRSLLQKMGAKFGMNPYGGGSNAGGMGTAADYGVSPNGAYDPAAMSSAFGDIGGMNQSGSPGMLSNFGGWFGSLFPSSSAPQ